MTFCVEKHLSFIIIQWKKSKVSRIFEVEFQLVFSCKPLLRNRKGRNNKWKPTKHSLEFSTESSISKPSARRLAQNSILKSASSKAKSFTSETCLQKIKKPVFHFLRPHSSKAHSEQYGRKGFHHIQIESTLFSDSESVDQWQDPTQKSETQIQLLYSDQWLLFHLFNWWYQHWSPVSRSGLWCRLHHNWVYISGNGGGDSS